MITLQKVIMAGSLCLVVTGTASLQAGNIPVTGPVPFEYFDRDNSGFVTEEEFYQTRSERQVQRAASGRLMRHAAEAPDFEYFDKDSDGKVSQHEFITGHQMRMERRHASLQNHRSEMSSYTDVLEFQDVDLDKSGTISNSEFVQARNHMMNKPQSQDSYRRNTAKLPKFMDIDVNGNGVIDPGEFRSHQLQH